MKKSQLVFVPCPVMGHVVSAVEFARLLINRHQHLSITVLIIRAPFDPNVQAYTHSLTSSLSFPERLQFTLLPPHPDPTKCQTLHSSSLLNSLVETQKSNVRDAVSKLNSATDSPWLAGFVVDMFCTAMIDVATEFGVPTMVFFTSSAAFLGFKLHIHTLRERDNVDTTELNVKDSGTEFAIPCYETRVPVSVFPSVMFDRDWTLFFLNNASRIKKAKGVIVNTFEELEPHALHSFSKSDLTVYPIGPILNVMDTKTTMTQRSDHVMEWLDDQPPSSVLFLCFGSRGYFDEQDQVTEIARALERSGVHFLWSLRRPPPKGPAFEAPRDYSFSELEEVLPEGFLERTADIGRVMGWAPQPQILAHRAVGGFVSHCGWNSILESIYYGVPIATWPLYAEQQLNAFQVVRELKISVEICMDYRDESDATVGKSGVISAGRIEKGIKEVMQKESEVRKKVKHMSEMSRRALMEGGSSYSCVGRFIHDTLNWK
ncbi:anthocyanidin 3-O-glucosyltransferase 6-like [Neltuma alba]|uniref:anthocyanidin 3-O-glucosyltransferase 6-like n=1 Tax=Neltuma alba TaxID=207710 RepID=UPI0010A3EF6E|nr:anthocyanidin 3-O-glucosyltransferase 6-like [Prosopis alba]